MVLDYTYHIYRDIFQNYTINEKSLNSYDLELILNSTSNEYDLQPVYNANGFLGIVTELQQVFLAIYDTGMSSHTYTGSEHIDITNNRISLNFTLKINGEVVLHPRLNWHVELHAATSSFAFLQNTVDGSQPIAISNSLDKSVEFFGGFDTPDFYNKTEIDAIGDELSSLILNTHTETEVGNLITNIDLVQKT